MGKILPSLSLVPYFPLAPPGNLLSVLDRCLDALAAIMKSSASSILKITTDHAILVKASFREKKSLKKVGRNQTPK